MKKLIFTFLLALTIWSCTTEELPIKPSPQRITQSENVTPVRLSSWVYSRKNGKHYINFQWLSDYGYPNLAYTPHYVTIYKDGILVEDFVQKPFNQYGVRVTSSWDAVYNITITQTVIGLGTSPPMTFQAYRQY